MQEMFLSQQYCTKNVSLDKTTFKTVGELSINNAQSNAFYHTTNNPFIETPVLRM